MGPIVNLAAYKFVPLDQLPRRRRDLQELCRKLELKGTILLSAEGINLFVAGGRPLVAALLERLRSEPELADLKVQESFSEDQPFNRMLVKIKHRIIPLDADGIQPAGYTSRRLAATTLRSWLDAGRPITLLDVRNDFEVRAGTFVGAVAIGIEHFREFPQAAAELPAELKQQPVVTFCTGGIRCEKAAPLLEQLGFDEVYQLDGGILDYFHQCGGRHYRGECFVFDKRVALDSSLRPTGTAQCFVCQAILTSAEQQSPQYVEGQSCPHCYRTAEQARAATLDKRRAALRAAARVLPGSQAYDNARPISVPLRGDGMRLLDFLVSLRTHLSRDQWQRICDAGQLQYQNVAVAAGRIVRAGERYFHLMPATREPDVNANIGLLYEDDALIVVDKPAPLPMHACGRFNRNTLAYLLDRVYAPIKLRPAHRLDANTSGLVVMSKTRDVARRLQPQFERGGVLKKYLARVHGHARQDRFESSAAIRSTPSELGVRIVDPSGLAAHTEFRVVERLADGTTLLDVRPTTGRTNQIRVHLWDLGTPICGDPAYLTDHRLGSQQTLGPQDAPLCLHAQRIEFTHPTSGQRVVFEAPRPVWGKVIA